MPALRAPPASHDERHDLHGQGDNHAHFPPPQFVAGEAPVRFTTAATVAIANPLADRLLMLFEDVQN